MRIDIENRQKYDSNTNTLYSNWVAGFFANCCVGLWVLAKLANEGIVPQEIKSDEDGWNLYTDISNTNSFASFFSPTNVDVNIPTFQSLPQLSNDLFGPHIDYSIILNKFKPFVQKWYEPNNHTKDIEQYLINKYKINFSKTIGICRRGTDKCCEVKVAPIEKYIKAAKDLLAIHPDHKILIQTDCAYTVDEFKKTFGNVCIHFNEYGLETSRDNSGNFGTAPSSVRTANKQFHGRCLLAVVSILSKCNIVINCTSNIALWIYLMRDYNGNEYQFNKDAVFIKNNFGI